MGGGDLNLKKSWHPSTLRNIERVWKAEQKHEAEQQKIEQLQKELAAERARDEIRSYAEDQGVIRKKDERLDWMYQGPAAMVNREDYLMGRKIDKTFELLQMQEKGVDPSKEESAEPTSLFHPSSSTSDVTVDLATKIREDPLFAIMKKEKEQRKNLLTNPVKMKQIQAMLKATMKKSKKKKSKKSKKSKKKHRRDSSSSSSSDSEEETVERHVKNGNSTSRSHDTEKEFSASRNGYKTSNREDGSYKHRSYEERYERSRSKYEPENRKERTKYDSRTTIHDEYKKDKQHEMRSPVFGNDRGHKRRHEEDSRNSHHRSKSEKKLSEEEKERLRQEMMDNAKWREKQREKNVKRYIKEDKKEDRVEKGSASDFIRPMLSKAAEKGSVENRVKQKIFTIQRNKADMDSNFARR